MGFRGEEEGQWGWAEEKLPLWGALELGWLSGLSPVEAGVGPVYPQISQFVGSWQPLQGYHFGRSSVPQLAGTFLQALSSRGWVHWPKKGASVEHTIVYCPVPQNLTP